MNYLINVLSSMNLDGIEEMNKKPSGLQSLFNKLLSIIIYTCILVYVPLLIFGLNYMINSNVSDIRGYFIVGHSMLGILCLSIYKYFLEDFNNIKNGRHKKDDAFVENLINISSFRYFFLSLSLKSLSLTNFIIAGILKIDRELYTPFLVGIPIFFMIYSVTYVIIVLQGEKAGFLHTILVFHNKRRLGMK